jgi:vacuolar-type H+-ATPase subunit E/Vma4
MAVETIIERIAQESLAEAAAIVTEAEREGQRLVEAAEARVVAQVDEALERAGPGIRAEAARRVNEVRLRLLEERARRDAERISAAFDAAAAQLQRIAAGADEPRWRCAIRRLCLEALRATGPSAEVHLRSRDVALVEDVLERHGAAVRALPDDAPAGPMAISADGRTRVDASLAVRLERARRLMAEEVAEVLGLGPGVAASDGEA